MAYSKALISAADNTLRTADKPILTSSNKGVAATTASWRTAKTLAVGSDASATNKPGRYAVDEHTHKPTEPAAAGTNRYLMFDFGASGIEFDTFAILQHNLNGQNLTVEISDNADMSSPDTVIATVAVASAKRYVNFVLGGGTGYRYSGVRYMAITINSAGAFTASIGEVFLGRRRQLAYRPDEPYDDELVESPADTTETLTGITDSVARGNPRRRILEAKILADDATRTADLVAWNVDVDGQRRPFMWFERPASDPYEAYLMRSREPEFVFPYEGPVARRLELNAAEVGPYYVAGE